MGSKLILIGRCLLAFAIILLGDAGGVLPVEAESTIIISEILPDPAGDDKAGEYIEIYNSSSFPADLTGWSLDDILAGGSQPYFLATIIQPGEYILFSIQTTKISLNNDADEVNLLDTNGLTVDSVAYAKSRTGFSYSLVNTQWHWNEFLTPGAKNVLLPRLKFFQAEPSAIDFSRSASVDFNWELEGGDASQFEIFVSLPSPFSKKLIAGEALEYQGFEISTSQTMAVQLEFWAGGRLTKTAAASLIFFQPLDSVVISEIYPSPATGELEYIELYNFGDYDVNMMFHRLDDILAGGSQPYFFSNEIISAKTYLTVYEDQSRIKLNNDGDSVHLIDASGREKDGVNYQSNLKGKSFSRFKAGWEWTDIQTPAAENQKIIYSPAIYISEILPNPAGRDDEGEYIEIFNSGDQTVDLLGWQLDDRQGAGSAKYTFAAEIIYPKQYLVISASQSGLILNNNEDWVYLIDPTGRVSSSIHYVNLDSREAVSYGYFQPNYFWTNRPTAGGTNLAWEYPAPALASLAPAETSRQLIQPISAPKSTASSIWYIPEVIGKTAAQKSGVSADINSIESMMDDLSRYLIEPVDMEIPRAVAGNQVEKAVAGAFTDSQSFASSRIFYIIKYIISISLILGALRLWRFSRPKKFRIRKE